MFDPSPSEQPGRTHSKLDPAQKPAKGPASFWISLDHLDTLLKGRATAAQIAAFLVMARHTEKDGVFSSAGMKAIKKKLGIGQTAALHAVQRLLALRNSQGQPILYLADEWVKQTQSELPPRPHVFAAIRYVLSATAEETPRIWWSAALVDGVESFDRPLMCLRQAGDLTARLYLALSKAQRLDQFFGVAPETLCQCYTLSETQGKFGHLCLKTATANQLSTKWELGWAIGIPSYSAEKKHANKKALLELETRETESWKPFWSAVEHLKAIGLICEAVCVLDRGTDDTEAAIVYSLHVHNHAKDTEEGQEGLASLTASLAKFAGCPVHDKLGKFDSRYAVAVESFITPTVVGIFRHRFRVSNPKNAGIGEANALRLARQARYRALLQETMLALQEESIPF